MVLYDPEESARAFRQIINHCTTETSIYKIITQGATETNVIQFDEVAPYLRGRRLFFGKEG